MYVPTDLPFIISTRLPSALKSNTIIGISFCLHKAHADVSITFKSFCIISAKEIVSNAIETIKGFFDFEWKLPEIKLPHFSISGNFSLNPPSIPSFGIEWYKDGGIMNDPTMFGFNPFSNKAMVGGEAGPEAIAPISTLQSYVRDAVSETNNKLYTVMNAVLSVLTQYLPELAHMQVVMDTGETVGVLATPMSEKLGKMTYMRERTN